MRCAFREKVSPGTELWGIPAGKGAVAEESVLADGGHAVVVVTARSPRLVGDSLLERSQG